MFINFLCIRYTPYESTGTLFTRFDPFMTRSRGILTCFVLDKKLNIVLHILWLLEAVSEVSILIVGTLRTECNLIMLVSLLP